MVSHQHSWVRFYREGELYRRCPVCGEIQKKIPGGWEIVESPPED